jgi:hypothetical protein
MGTLEEFTEPPPIVTSIDFLPRILVWPDRHALTSVFSNGAYPS